MTREQFLIVAQLATLAEETHNAKAMKFQYAKLIEHIADKLRDIGEDGDQADQLVYVLSGGR